MTAIPPTQVCGEQHRFEKLMEYFRNEDSNIDFMVSSGAQPGPGHPRVPGAVRSLGIWDLGSAPADMRTEWLVGEGRMSVRGRLGGGDVGEIWVGQSWISGVRNVARVGDLGLNGGVVEVTENPPPRGS